MAEAEIPPAAIAGAVVAARGLLRLEGGVEEGLLQALARTALLLGEAFVGQRLIVRAFEDRVSADGTWRRLAAEPVVAATGVPAGVAIDIDASGAGWVRASAGGVVTIGYSAGVAAPWEALPAPIAQGVAMLMAHLFARPDGPATPPAAIAALWRPWRRMRMGSARR
jgi:hypothetical protein